MGILTTEEENRIINLLASDAEFSLNVAQYRSLILEWGRRDRGDRSARPFAKISAALDTTVAARKKLSIVTSLGADSKLVGLAYQRVVRQMTSKAAA